MSFTVADANTVFTLTDAAAGKIKELIAAEGEDDLVLRVAVRPGGCSGLSYEMFFDSDVSDDDQKTTWGDVTVVVDPASAPHLGGATLDYKDTLQGAGFHINNPSADRTCGCGQSFSSRANARFERSLVERSIGSLYCRAPMRCPHCSALLDRGSSRCWRCWLPIVGVDTGSTGPRVSRADRRRAVERAQHRVWRRRVFRASGVLVLVAVAAFFVYDTIIVDDPRPDDELAAAVLPTLEDLPSNWARNAESSSLAPNGLAECEPILGAPLTDATAAEEAAAFRFNGGPSLVVAESFLLADGALTERIVRAYGGACATSRVAGAVVDAPGLAAADSRLLELDADDVIVQGRRIRSGIADNAWVVDVLAVGADRGLIVLARASRGGVNGGVNTQALVDLVAPRVAARF